MATDRKRRLLTRGAELIYRYRVLKQLSQIALGKALGMPLSSATRKIWAWENGRGLPSLRWAVRLEVLTHGAIPCGAWLVDLASTGDSGTYANNLRRAMRLTGTSK